MHKALPQDAISMLKRASLVENTPDDPRRRQKAVEHAIARVKREFPSFFREEDHEAADCCE